MIPEHQTAILSMREGKFDQSVPVDVSDGVGKLGRELNEFARVTTLGTKFYPEGKTHIPKTPPTIFVRFSAERYESRPGFS